MTNTSLFYDNSVVNYIKCSVTRISGMNIAAHIAFKEYLNSSRSNKTPADLAWSPGLATFRWALALFTSPFPREKPFTLGLYFLMISANKQNILYPVAKTESGGTWKHAKYLWLDRLILPTYWQVWRNPLHFRPRRCYKNFKAMSFVQKM